MKISNKDTGEKEQPFAEMFRLQTEFQSRLADETLRYLRRLQGSAAPASPGTIVIPENNNELTASAKHEALSLWKLRSRTCRGFTHRRPPHCRHWCHRPESHGSPILRQILQLF